MGMPCTILGSSWPDSPQCKHADVQHILPDEVQVEDGTCGGREQKSQEQSELLPAARLGLAASFNCTFSEGP